MLVPMLQSAYKYIITSNKYPRLGYPICMCCGSTKFIFENKPFCNLYHDNDKHTTDFSTA